MRLHSIQYARGILALAGFFIASLFFNTTASAQAQPKEIRIGFQKGSAILVLARKQGVISEIVWRAQGKR